MYMIFKNFQSYQSPDGRKLAQSGHPVPVPPKCSSRVASRSMQCVIITSYGLNKRRVGKLYNQVRRATLIPFPECLRVTGLPDFSWQNIPKREIIYQMTTIYTHFYNKLYQIAIKITKYP
jgi:hypothetical protein